MSRAASRCCRNCRRTSRDAQALGISFFAGEAEERPIRRGAARRLERQARAALQLHGQAARTCTGEPPPFLPRQHVRRTSGSLSSIDLGRGCPYQCSFCTIINVQGRKSRFRSPDDLERIVRENYAQGIKRFFITDDNFARNRDWEVAVRPADPAARQRASRTSASPSRSTRSATRSRTSSRRRRKPACGASSSGSRTSTPTT